MKKRFLFVAMLLCVATMVEAQPRVPHGKWWRRPAMASKLELTKVQQAKLDEVFTNAANNLIDGKAEVRKLEVALRAELDRPELRRAEITRIVSQLSAARARLFDRELMMLVEMRTVLENHQWERLQEAQMPQYQPGRLGRRPR